MTKESPGKAMNVYRQPLYYETAFSFINPRRQVDLFLRFIGKYSGRPVKRFLDVGCGPALQLREIASRGYEAVGLDSSRDMLEHAGRKAKEGNVRIETVRADMTDFVLAKKVDFAFVMMGTINYMRSNDEFLRHLDCVAKSLRKGGLYLIENLRLDWANTRFFDPQSWTMESEGIKVRTTYGVELKDALTQTLRETLRLDVNDHGKRIVLEQCVDTKMIFPQEFLALIELSGRFEFIGWFERERMKKLRKAGMDNICILRKKR